MTKVSGRRISHYGPMQAKYYPALQAINAAYQVAGFLPKKMYIPNTPPNTPRKVTPYTLRQYKKIFDPQTGLPKKNMFKKFHEKTKFSNVNALAQKASMKMTTKKLKAKRVRKVYVPKKLKKQIKQTLMAGNLTGKVIASRIGTIGIANPNTNPGTKAILGANTLPAYFPLSTGPSSHNYSSWFIPHRIAPTTNDATNVADYLASDAFTYFHPAKFIDAASALWNRKTFESTSWLTQIGNLDTRIITATGAPGDVNRVSNVQFHIINSFVEFELKNVSQRECSVRILNCTPKHKILNNYPLSTYVAGVAEDIVENGHLDAAYTTGFNKPDVTNPHMNPRDVPYFSGQYHYSVMEILIKPGETCKHSIQGPKNVMWDSKNFIVNNLEGEQYQMKGTQSLIFQVLPDTQVITTTFGAGNFINTTASDDQFKCPITVRSTETYLLKCSEQAGFIINNSGANGKQTLNQKRRACIIGDFASYNTAVVAYAGHDEEMPASEILPSLKF